MNEEGQGNYQERVKIRGQGSQGESNTGTHTKKKNPTKSICILKSIYYETCKSTTLDLATRSLVVFTKAAQKGSRFVATLLNHKTAEWEAHIPNLGVLERGSLGSGDLQRQGPWATCTRIIWGVCLKLLIQGPNFKIRTWGGKNSNPRYL